MMPPLADLHWARPWAWLLLALPAGLALRRRHARAEQARAALAYADAHMQAWALRTDGPRPGLARGLVWWLLWLLAATALAGPRQLLAVDAAGAASPRHRADLMVVLRLPDHDAPSLAAARMALHALQRRLHGERLGLVVFNRGAGLLLPCTDDPAVFDDFLDRAGPGLLEGTTGDGLAQALWLARRELRRETGPSKAIVLLSGEPDAGDAQGQADALEAARVPVFLLWTGAGEVDPRLEALASRSGGASARLGSPGAWTLLVRQGIERLPSDPPRPGSEPVWRELYGLPLAGAMLLLTVLHLPAVPRARAGLLRGVLLLVVPGLSTPGLSLLGLPSLSDALPHAHAAAAQASRAQALQAWKAWQAWTRHDFPGCARMYAGLAGFDAAIGEGDCAYRAGQWPEALRAFRRAMLLATSDPRRARALYNLGNAAFHVQGGLLEALDAYRASLVLQPGNARALRNLRLAQAQWDQEHPEDAAAALRKGGLPRGQGAFGDTADTTPSSMAARPGQRRPQGYENQRLQAGGQLRLSTAQPEPSAPGLRLDPAEVLAARRGMQLLRDHRDALLRAQLRQDSREAADPRGPR